jgi:hypothetical protein
MISSTLHDAEMEAYIIRRSGWEPNIFHHVDWDAYSQAMVTHK